MLLTSKLHFSKNSGAFWNIAFGFTVIRHATTFFTVILAYIMVILQNPNTISSHLLIFKETDEN